MTASLPFDEMGLGADATRPIYRHIARWLAETPPEILASRRAQAEFMFRRIGITFGVYGDKDAAERLIPFDIVPRVISRAEWTRLEAGLIQRVTALNLFLKDVYGSRTILKENIIPQELILSNPHYRPEMIGRRVPHDIWVHIAGIDIVRVSEDAFYVLEDNARTPSGVSYMLENREVTMRLAPDLFAEHSVAPVDDYPDLLLACLRSVTPRTDYSEATIVILTPGPFNSAYYEHSFLADKLGVELVEGRDLFVADDVVFMRTTLGPKRVDVIYRRVDDDFLDPLVFNPDSILGVPGLMGAYLAGNVTVANAVGTGIADDKAIYTYVPDLIKFYLQQEPLLQNVPTYRCRESEALQFVLERLHPLVGQGSKRPPRGATRDVRRQAEGRPRQLHRAADAGAFDLSGLVRRRRLAAARRSQALRALRRQRGEDRARRAHAGRADQGLARGQFESGRRHEGHVGGRRRRGGLSHARAHRRQSLLARPLDGARRFYRPYDRGDAPARISAAQRRRRSRRRMGERAQRGRRLRRIHRRARRGRRGAREPVFLLFPRPP